MQRLQFGRNAGQIVGFAASRKLAELQPIPPINAPQAIPALLLSCVLQFDNLHCASRSQHLRILNTA